LPFSGRHGIQGCSVVLMTIRALFEHPRQRPRDAAHTGHSSDVRRCGEMDRSWTPESPKANSLTCGLEPIAQLRLRRELDKAVFTESSDLTIREEDNSLLSLRKVPQSKY
jgi:hypothetical protein